MPPDKRHSSDPSLYYITFTCRQWLPLFEVVNAYELVYNWFNYLKANHSIKTTSYVVMPNHVHCILFFPNGNYDLSKIIANGKRFIAYEIVRRLEQKGCNNILMQLKEGVSEKQPGKGQRHKVFEESFDAKPVYHRKFPEQKINYIHLNPVRGKWRLVEHWEDYEHSSAGYYVKNKAKEFTSVHFEELS